MHTQTAGSAVAPVSGKFCHRIDTGKCESQQPSHGFGWNTLFSSLFTWVAGSAKNIMKKVIRRIVAILSTFSWILAVKKFLLVYIGYDNGIL